MIRFSPVPVTVLLLVFVAVPHLAAGQDRFYVRGSVGYDRSRDATLRDRSCDPAPLLVYFGCGEGDDGRALGAYGDFGSSAAVEIALGSRVLRPLRVELGLLHRPGHAFDANANFVNAGSEQPVSADVTQSAVIARAALDLVPLFGRDLGWFEPFVGVGLGLARNRIGPVTYVFPELPANPATTTTGGGTGWDQAWDLSLGTGLRVTSRSLLEIAYRYSDTGHVKTDDGAIDVLRGANRVRIDNVAGTRAPLGSHDLYLGLRWSL